MDSLPPTPFVKLTEHGSTAVIQLNRPEALNALDLDMTRYLARVIELLESEKDVVIIKGSEKVFCVGGDLKQFSELPFDKFKDGIASICRAIDLLSNYQKPFVSLMHGLSFGGSSIYSLPAKYHVVTEKTVFSMPENAVGYFNDAGSSYFLSRLARNFGIYLGLTGERLKGSDLKKLKLATHFVESSKLSELEAKLIDCKTTEDIEIVLKELSSEPTSTNAELDAILPRIEKCFGASTIEEIYENLRLDGSEWALKTIKTLDRMSPTSLKVSLRSMNLGKTLPLRDCLKMEFRLTYHHIIKSDVHEGVRALLVDKDFKPKWNPSKLSEVTDEHVARFFGPLPEGEELEFESSLSNKL